MPETTEINRKSLEVIKKVTEEVINVRWTIDNFTESYSSGEQLESDEFYIEDNMFTLVLNCPGFRENEDFSFFLGQYFEERDFVEIEAKAWLEDLDGNKYYESKIDDSDITERIVAAHYFGESLQKEDLGTKIQLKNDTAIFCAEIREVMPGKEIPKIDLELRQKLWKSYQEGLIDSITIQVEGKTFKVSKTILAANSDVFERMLLTSNCKEVQSGIIEIKEASYDAMKVFIEYLHRGEVENMPEKCDDLFVLAHRYMVIQLQNDCAKVMSESLNKENVVERLKLAFMYEQDDLKDATLEYITSKESDMNFCQLLKSTQWHNLIVSNGPMANEITSAVFEKTKWLGNQDEDQVPSKRPKLE